MNNIISSIFFTILLIIVGITPVPSIPIAILNYKINGLTLGYLSTLIAGTIASAIYFLFANFYLRNIFRKRFIKKYKSLKKYSDLIARMSYLEFILLLLSGIIPNSMISVASGLAKMNFKKFIICYILVGIPQQLILLIGAAQLDYLNKLFLNFGISDINSLLYSLGAICLILFITIKILKYLTKFIKFD